MATHLEHEYFNFWTDCSDFAFVFNLLIQHFWQFFPLCPGVIDIYPTVSQVSEMEMWEKDINSLAYQLYFPYLSYDDHNYCTEHAYSFVTSWLDAGSVVNVVMSKFSKVFDVVNNNALLLKLSCLGISGTTVLFSVESSLKNKTMSLSVSGTHSSSRWVMSSVLQGSVLGPLLFLIYSSYLPSTIANNCQIFAHDPKNLSNSETFPHLAWHKVYSC